VPKAPAATITTDASICARRRTAPPRERVALRGRSGARRPSEHGHDTAGFGEPARNDGADGSTADDHDVATHQEAADLVIPKILFPRVSSRVQNHNGISIFHALRLDVVERSDVLVQLLVGRGATVGKMPATSLPHHAKPNRAASISNVAVIFAS
jgi:hypothetical protein